MQVLTAFYIICLVIILIGGGITIYGDRKSELFCLFTGPCIMIVGVGLLICGLTL
jgi:hypothetical protein